MSARFVLCIGLLVGFGLVVPSRTAAETPLGTAFSYQGRLGNNGSPASGLHDLRFRLYMEPMGGSQIGDTLCDDDVSMTDGLFTLSLDFGAQFAGDELYLEIDVRADTGLGCADPAGFVRLAPRQQLTAAPHALFSLSADRLDGLDSTAFLQSIPVPLTLSGTSFTHIIRGENASTALNAAGVFGAATATTGVGLTYGGRFESAGTQGSGVFGLATHATGVTSGVFGSNVSTSGRGVYGLAGAASGETYGVYGQSNSTSGRGVYGTGQQGGRFESTNSGLGGVGVYGSGDDQGNASTSLNTGVFGVSRSVAGAGVLGFASAEAGTTYGVFGTSTSTFGTGVFGEATTGVEGRTSSGRGVCGLATATNGITYGGFFSSTSTSGVGVYGSGRYGVYAESANGDGAAVFGWTTAAGGFTYGGEFRSDSTNGRGVYGFATGGSGTIYGVLGQANLDASGFGVFSFGDMGASGTKPYRIDHPDDPANKYLLHYAAESPEVINFYSETVTLDERGEAVVELPHYFAKINIRARYQLTAVGAPMPMLHVAEKISESALGVGAKAGPDEVAPLCSFRIAGGAPGGEVSWEVKAVRNDRWVQQRGAPVEVEKQDLERGKYQHPELYSQHAEMGMDYEAERERRSPATSPDETRPE